MLSYQLDIRNFRELRFFLFVRKTCPRCRGRLQRVDALPEYSSGWERDGLEFEYVSRTKEAIRYRCDPCHSYFSLAELASAS